MERTVGLTTEGSVWFKHVSAVQMCVNLQKIKDGSSGSFFFFFFFKISLYFKECSFISQWEMFSIHLAALSQLVPHQPSAASL